jgi:arabinogalactan oligomer / maltooligosaccharide transport system permease protein
MSETGTTAPPAPPAPPSSKPRRRRGQPWFGGSTGTALVAKIVGLALVNALAIFGALTLWSFEAWGMLAALVALTVVINWAYLSSRTLAAKYLVPGLIFLLVYQIFIVLYTLGLSFTNFGDGNQGTKEAAIETLLARNEKRVEGSPALPATIIERGGELGFLVTSPDTGELVVGTAEVPLEPAEGAEYTELTFAQVIERQNEVFNLRVAISEDPEDGSLRTTDGRTAFLFRPILTYDEGSDTLTNVETGETFVADSEVGRFRSTESGRTITPGWQQFVGLENYTRLLTDSRIREPFLSVFVWNFVFAFFSVLLPFALGLAAAMALQHKTMRGVRLYRSVLILPYAIPAFLTTLVWQGMLNTRFGFVNQVLLDGASIPWLSDPFLARFSVLFVQLWLGFPYFLIISTGALTSIPEDILEAAKVDGATANQTFWRVKWPLLLIAVAPLMIASFAFNFNNYNVIRFLTNGGPLDTTAAVTYGATDILITFVDKLAFQGVARQYGFASAISIVIFILIAAISYIGFKRTQTFEEID